MESDDNNNDMPAQPQMPSTSKTPDISPDEDFILTLETLPELWDKKCNDYVNKYKRRIGYEKLLKILIKIKPRATIEDVKKKINSLRSNYRRELKKIVTSKRSGAGTSEVYEPKSWTFKYLAFLNNSEQPVSQIQKHNQDSDDSSHIQEQNDSQDISREVLSQQSDLSLSSINVMTEPAAVNEGSNTKRYKSTVARTQNELLKKACAYLAQPTKTCSPAALLWSEKLEELDRTQRLYAEKAINDILFEAQLGNLHRFSVKINQSADTSSPVYSSSATYTPSPQENRCNYSNISQEQLSEHFSSVAYSPSHNDNIYTAPSPQSQGQTVLQTGSASQIIITHPVPNPKIQTSQTSAIFPPPSSMTSSTPLLVHAKPTKQLDNCRPSPSLASSAPVVNIQTDAQNQQGSYTLHIPSPSQDTSESTLSEYNVGTLFAHFKPDL